MRLLLLLVLALPLIAASPEPTACPSPQPPFPEHRDASGLLVLPPLPRCVAPPYEPLASAYSDARMLAEANPQAFGYPWDDRPKRELVISVVNAEGDRIARSWISGGATAAMGGGKSANLPPPGVAVRIRSVTRSFAQLSTLEDDIIAFIRTGVTDMSGIHSFGHDDERDGIVIEVDHLDAALATALAARFGTDAIAIRIDPGSASFTSISAAKTDEPDRLPYVAVAVAALLLAIGLVYAVGRTSRNKSRRISA